MSGQRTYAGCRGYRVAKMTTSLEFKIKPPRTVSPHSLQVNAIICENPGDRFAAPQREQIALATYRPLPFRQAPSVAR